MRWSPIKRRWLVGALRVELDTRQRTDLAPHGWGAKPTAVAGEKKYVTCIDGGANHCSQGELGAHFGLGKIKLLDAVYIEWPDDHFSVLTDVATNQILHVSAPVSSADFNHDGQVTQADLDAFLAAYAAGDLHADFDGDHDVDADDLAAFQALWEAETPKGGGRNGLQQR